MTTLRHHQQLEALAHTRVQSCQGAIRGALSLAVALQVSAKGFQEGVTVHVSHLPPLSLQMVFPASYPAVDPPEARLSAFWLSPAQLETLQNKLSELWQEQVGMPVCYTWADWLKTSALEHLGITDTLLLEDGNPTPTDQPDAASVQSTPVPDPAQQTSSQQSTSHSTGAASASTHAPEHDADTSCSCSSASSQADAADIKPYETQGPQMRSRQSGTAEFLAPNDISPFMQQQQAIHGPGRQRQRRGRGRGQSNRLPPASPRTSGQKQAIHPAPCSTPSISCTEPLERSQSHGKQPAPPSGSPSTARTFVPDGRTGGITHHPHASHSKASSGSNQHHPAEVVQLELQEEAAESSAAAFQPQDHMGHTGPEAIVVQMLQYDASRKAALFRQGRWTCGICFEEVGLQ